MNVGLISPQGIFYKNQLVQELEETIQRFKVVWSGLSSGLLTTAALTPANYQIAVIDENVESIDFEADYDLVGITFMTQQATRAYEIADRFRRQGVTVVLGGIHPTILPEEAINHADSVVIGEAEYVWPELIRDFEHQRLRPFYQSHRRVDLKDSPVPRYDLIRDKGYKNIWIQTSRGCPHDCEFCAASKIFGRQYRRKTTAQVIAEVKLVKEIFGNNVMISFSDDNFFVDRSKTLDLLNALIPLKVKWCAQSDISIADKEALLDLLRPSGCMLLFIGFESLHGDNLRNIDKHNWKLRRLAGYSEGIRRLQTRGIPVMGSFIIGLENDTQTVFDHLKEFVIDNYLADSYISILTPYPGTALRQRLEKENRILANLWDFYTGTDVNIIHKKLTKKEMEHALVDILQTVYAPEVRLRTMTYFKDIYRELGKHTQL